MTPFSLFVYLCAVAAGLGVIGVVLLGLLCLLMFLRGMLMDARRG